jgi:iron complex transport system ATP-binding protein
MSLVELRGASFGYNHQDIFKDINFKIGKGEILCIIGPNGCGKTTLLDSILGILKLRRGDVLINGNSIQRMQPHEIARQIAYIPQAHNKTFPYTVLDVVLMGRAAYTGIFSSPSDEDVEIAEEALGLVGLTRLKSRPYTQLSGGEGQLVMIARALAQKTPLMIMDEPTAHLDFKHELTVLETIVQLINDTDLSIIMATHFPNHAFYFENNNIKTSVALMDRKTFSLVGRPAEIISEENLMTLYNINAKVVSCNIGSGSELKQIIPISTIS